ncbi:MAG TPA: amidohydrolase family protein [Bryobacteraceae bacterium]|nr:amidohydrolase family protein [Bryobacteraceae bacterium]
MRRLFSTALLVLLLAASAQAEPADWIYTARYVVTMDAQRRLIDDGAVAIRGENIVGVGKRAEIEKQFQARQHLDRPDAILMPGLINTHAHAAMSLFRGIADDLRLQDWLQNYIFPAESKNVTPDFVLWGTRLACLEMMLSGTTTFVDMYYYEDQAAKATKEAGLRGVLGETIMRFKTPDAPTPQDSLRFTEKFLQQYRGDPLIVAAPAPHAVYTNNDFTLKAARALANKYHVPLVIHLSETKQENDDLLKARHVTPTRLLEMLGVLDGPTIAAHGVWLNDADMRILKAHGTGIAHCPSSNMKLASGVAPVVKLLALGIPVGVGTDGPAGSNNDFDLMEEMNLAADLQKVSTGDPTAIPAQQAVAMATVLGARVAGLENLIGSLETGKRADLITLRLDRPHAVPLYNVYSQIVYALKGSDVEDVMVNGKPIVREGRSLTLDSHAILAKAVEYGAKVAASLRKN